MERFESFRNFIATAKCDKLYIITTCKNSPIKLLSNNNITFNKLACISIY